MVFLFRFKYEHGRVGLLLIRVNRITGIAKVYYWSENLGKYELYKKEGYTYKHNEYSIDLDKILDEYRKKK